MLNVGKEKYNSIVIPEDKLLYAIERGIHKKKQLERKKGIQSCTLAVASILLLLFTCANVPVIYAYAKEFPVVKVFVQAFHVGSGGGFLGNVELQVEGDSQNVIISFHQENVQTDHVLSYSIRYFSSPVRVEITFHGKQDINYKQIEEKILKLDAVQDIYPLVSLEEDDISFAIILEKGYNYEVMEFSNPGVLSMHFFHDAYYVEGEKHPNQTIYYIRSSAVSDKKELKRLLKKYQQDTPSQVKTAEGNYIIVVGEYDTEEGAKQGIADIAERYGQNSGLFYEGKKVSETPHD